MRILILALAGVSLAVHLLAASAAADDDARFRRTTPRGSFGRDGSAILIGIPGGRAWGIESALMPAPAGRAAFVATVAVRDHTVREAFVRIAWYDRATGRPKQFALSDARLVQAGEIDTIEVMLDPPPGAVAYRVRVLARLRAPTALSATDAVRATLSGSLAPASAFPLTRLLP